MLPLADECQAETVDAERQQPRQENIGVCNLELIAQVVEAVVLEHLQIRVQREQRSQQSEGKVDFGFGEFRHGVPPP